jgi:cell wall-associated NlpC family hydrolase
MIWANAYIGIPFADLGRDVWGCDCWGLARLVYKTELSISLPSYAGDYVSAQERAEIDNLINQPDANIPWSQVTVPQPFDLLLFRRGQMRSHVAIAVDTRRMLHMDGEEQARIADFTLPRWSSRFCGAFQHIERGLKDL